MKVTSLEPERGGRRVVVSFDDSRHITVSAETAAGLRVGQTVDEKALAGIRADDRFRKALETALRYLEYRPRSEKEVRQRLQRSGCSGRTIDRVLTELRQRKLVDDRAFAVAWCESRAAGSPRGRRAVLGELLARGIDRETAGEAVAGLDDGAAAYEAGRKKLRSLTGLDYATFRKKLGGYLQRRGFDYEVIDRTIRRLWRELVS